MSEIPIVMMAARNFKILFMKFNTGGKDAQTLYINHK